MIIFMQYSHKSPSILRQVWKLSPMYGIFMMTSESTAVRYLLIY